VAGLSRPALRVACVATQGADSNDAHRITTLLEPLEPLLVAFDHAAKPRSGMTLLRRLVRERPDVVVMEGTGVAGGLAVLTARTLAGVPFIVSSGDAVAPYLSARRPALRPLVTAYERLLCRRSAGFIGWSPYLAGRALTFGAPRAMTAPGWAPAPPVDRDRARAAVRADLGIPADALVFGIVGSLAWNPRMGYCYGRELVDAVARVTRDDVRILIVGDGMGRRELERLAGPLLGGRVILPGHVPRERVMAMLSAIDVGSLPQTLDGVGSFRYTTKISEYLAAGVPVATGQIPLAYDLDEGWLWRLAGDTPWSERYIASLAELMQSLSPSDLERRRRATAHGSTLFSLERQRRQVCEFVRDIAEGGS
jgi:glycosyltransferase involved in cell wall biosynthesis